MIELLEFARFHYFSEWISLLAVIVGVIAINRAFRLNFINALVPSQTIFIFNAIPIIAGFVDGYLSINLVTHFFLTEVLLLTAICGCYVYITKLARQRSDQIIAFFDGMMPYILIVLALAIAAFVYVVTPQDGTSRIEYQTNYWYSLIKPVLQIFGPLSYFAVFILLFVHEKRLPAYLLLVANVAGSIASGSKGAFMINAITALLLVRDMQLAARFRMGRIDIGIAAAGLILGLAVSLQRLQLTAADLWDRIMLFGEPTLLTYFAPDPTAACRNLTLLAKMHRGWARAIGDPTALNIDTLFGYAWTIQYVGVNTFTGPNARYSAYMICNFPGLQVVFGLIMTLLYLFLIVTAMRKTVGHDRFLPIVYAYAVFSMTTTPQDFNLLMQDINFLIGMVAVMIVLPVAKMSRVRA